MALELQSTIFICGPATKVIAERSAGTRWCFVCRKRIEFTDQCHATVEPSYYDPTWTRKCPRGHVDGDVGFGRVREWA